jgi:hypothetical protein
VAIPAMKKVSPDEISVEVSLKNKTEDHEEEKKNTLYTLIKKFTQPETLDENNLYRCSNCKKEVQGLRQIRLYKLPFDGRILREDFWFVLASLNIFFLAQFVFWILRKFLFGFGCPSI